MVQGVAIGASGYMGVAIETNSGTYEEPTKFFPIRSESLQWTQATVWRRVIRSVVDPIGAVAGNGHVEGEIDMELLEDVLPYWLAAARGTLTQVDNTGDMEYTFTPSAQAEATNTLTIVVVRNDEVFAYTGCAVTGMTFGVDEGMGTQNISIIGQQESNEDAPGIPTYEDTGPFGDGMFRLEIPTATQIFDADSFSLSIDDSGNPEFRLKDTRGAQFVSYGERTVELSLERDFINRDEYTDFKELTAKSVRLTATKDADRFVNLQMPAAIIDTFELSLSGVGDLVRASVSYMGVHDDTTGGGYEIVVGTDEDLGLAP